MNRKNLEVLRAKLAGSPQNDYPVHSRIHPLRTFQMVSTDRVFVKREDELSFGVSGSKIRKYRTLIPELLQKGCREAVIIGGAYSNNVVSIAQVLLENGIKPIFFLRGSRPAKQTGNFFFLQLLAEKDSIHWIGGADRERIEEIACEYAASHAYAGLIPEGASSFSAFLGSLTLSLDILCNEDEHQLFFDHIFIDSGTGCTAAALLCAFSFLQKKTLCHVLLLADEESVFIQKLQTWHAAFEQWLGVKCLFPTSFKCYRSSIASSFGSTNQTLFQFIALTAKNEGFFLDPIYSSKLFYYVKHRQEVLSGNTLVIHSGGALSLSGFQEQMMLANF